MRSEVKTTTKITPGLNFRVETTQQKEIAISGNPTRVKILLGITAVYRITGTRSKGNLVKIIVNTICTQNIQTDPKPCGSTVRG